MRRFRTKINFANNIAEDHKHLISTRFVIHLPPNGGTQQLNVEREILFFRLSNKFYQSNPSCQW